jgi:hypothetical protein
LLVLGCEVQRPHGLLELVQNFARLPLGVQEVADLREALLPGLPKDPVTACLCDERDP